jgi:N,N'-diacetyllegionaminate synthase
MNNPVLVIAEAGVNHNGRIEVAKRLIEVAAGAGADFVKFQTFRADQIVSANAALADYQKKNVGAGNQLQMLKALEIGPAEHTELIACCEKAGIAFLSTPFDLPSIELLKALGVKIGKIPSGEITNLPFLRAMAGSFEKLIMSCGMSDVSEVAAALNAVTACGFHKSNITILHCNTEYPTPFEDVNLMAMVALKQEFGVKVGYSDHTQGIEVPVAAVALGATIIEKHFTLDRRMEGPDHKASLEPGELVQMIRSIRNIERSLGTGEKRVMPSEKKNREIARKSIVAVKAINKGEIFSEHNLGVKRPGYGISPMLWDDVLGKPAKRNFAPDEMIEL